MAYVEHFLLHFSSRLTRPNSKQLALVAWQVAQRPDIQQALRDEMSKFEGSGPDGRPTYDDYLNRLPLLDAVVKEA